MGLAKTPVAAGFPATSRGGRFGPPAFRPRLRRRAPPPKVQTQHLSNLKNSNREAVRLEITVTTTKQRTPSSSNRENKACSTFVGAAVHYRPGLALGFGSGSVVLRGTNSKTGGRWSTPTATAERQRQSATNGAKIEIGSPQKCCD